MEKEAKFEWAALTSLEHTIYAVICEHANAMNAMEIYYLVAEDIIDQNRNGSHVQPDKLGLKRLEALDSKYLNHRRLPAYPRAEAEKILKEYRKACTFFEIPVFTTIIKALEDGVRTGWIKKRTVSTGRASGVYYLPDEIKAFVKPRRAEALGHD